MLIVYLYKDGDMPGSLLNYVYLQKGSLLQNFNRLNSAATTTRDTSVKQIMKDLKEIQMELADRYQVIGGKNKSRINELELAKENLEKQLMQQLPQFQNEISKSKTTWDKVKSKLKPNEAAVEIIRFYFHRNYWTDTVLYAAFIIRPEWNKPEFVPLFLEDQLLKILSQTNAAISTNNLYRGSEEVEILESIISTNAYNLIWHPLEKYLNGVTNLYISPSGLLHRISFAALADSGGKRLIEKIKLNYVNCTRSVAEEKNTRENNQTIVLFGGVNYDQSSSLQSEVTRFTTNDTTVLNTRTMKTGKWNFLTGTENEITVIKKIAESRKRKVFLYKGEGATEEQFKLLGTDNKKVPGVIHIASHGFSFPIPKVETKDREKVETSSFDQSDDPLNRCGIVLAGGNQI